MFQTSSFQLNAKIAVIMFYEYRLQALQVGRTQESLMSPEKRDFVKLLKSFLSEKRLGKTMKPKNKNFERRLLLSRRRIRLYRLRFPPAARRHGPPAPSLAPPHRPGPAALPPLLRQHVRARHRVALPAPGGEEQLGEHHHPLGDGAAGLLASGPLARGPGHRLCPAAGRPGFRGHRRRDRSWRYCSR